MQSRDSNQNSNRAPRRGRRGFTLVEILIVVVILGILATLVIPQFSDASVTARENTLKDEVRYLRTQIIVYKAQHNDTPCGYPDGNVSSAPTAEAFNGQMCKYTNENGIVSNTLTGAYRFGPYLSSMPINPLNNNKDVLVVGDADAMPACDGSTGWIYKPKTGEIIANLVGNDSNGTPYRDY